MTRLFAAYALTCLAWTGISTAAELEPGSGHSIHLTRFGGVVYYTVEQEGYRVVATLASGAGELPIRFISMLEPGRRVVISVPQAAGQPSIDLEILRKGDALLVSAPISTAAIDLTVNSPPSLPAE